MFFCLWMYCLCLVGEASVYCPPLTAFEQVVVRWTILNRCSNCGKGSHWSVGIWTRRMVACFPVRMVWPKGGSSRWWCSLVCNNDLCRTLTKLTVGWIQTSCAFLLNVFCQIEAQIPQEEVEATRQIPDPDEFVPPIPPPPYFSTFCSYSPRINPR